MKLTQAYELGHARTLPSWVTLWVGNTSGKLQPELAIDRSASQCTADDQQRQPPAWRSGNHACMWVDMNLLNLDPCRV